jgi:hypothetical protein
MAGLGQFDSTIHHPVVSNGHSRHVLSFGLFDQIFDHGRPIKQAVLSVQM